MKEKIADLKQAFEGEINRAGSTAEVQGIRVKYLGRKSAIQSLMQELRLASTEMRPQLGALINQLKEHVSAQIEAHLERLASEEMQASLSLEQVDITLPGRKKFVGSNHPISHMLEEVTQILIGMGFSVQESPEIESDYYNYEGLNYPPDHPARDMQDTFYIAPDLLLRSHTTAIQQRLFEKVSPPIRILCAGKCYRNETITARSHVFFHQVDVLYVDREVTFSDLLAAQEAFYHKLFNQKIFLRFRPSYFPFVEPGMEVDIRCTSCRGKGCGLCKQTGWLEVAGAGMVHPNVLKKGDLDPEIYSGYAWGLGIERLCMLRHGIHDIRLFTENDFSFLSQFSSV